MVDKDGRNRNEEGEFIGQGAMVARAALIIACMALAVAILGLFLPLSPRG